MSFLGPILGAAGSIFGGLFGANASSKASQQYIDALKQAQQFIQGQEQQGLGNYQPYLNVGAGATGMLSEMANTGTGPFAQWNQQFQAPTAAQAAQTPGYQFQLQQGENALQNSAAAQGGLLSGGTLAGMNQFAQGLASSNYQNTFNNALTQYNSAYQSFLNNQNNTYQRLMGLSGEGLSAAGGAGNLISGIGGDIASLYGQQGAARAGGTLGSANSILGMIPGLTGSLSQLAGAIPSLGGGSVNTGIPGWAYGGAG
jgi:hypothetical protein